jgi:hypothetical protein
MKALLRSGVPIRISFNPLALAQCSKPFHIVLVYLNPFRWCACQSHAYPTPQDASITACVLSSSIAMAQNLTLSLNLVRSLSIIIWGDSVGTSHGSTAIVAKSASFGCGCQKYISLYLSIKVIN